LLAEEGLRAGRWWLRLERFFRAGCIAGSPARLVVEQVSGAAERAGIEAGDVLLAINGKPVSSIEQIRGVLKSQPKSVALLVQRDGNRLFIPVQVG